MLPRFTLARTVRAALEGLACLAIAAALVFILAAYGAAPEA